MNFTVSKNKFYAALQNVAHAISPNSPLPVLKGIKINANEPDSLILTASNNDLAIQTSLSNEQDKDLNLTIEEGGAVVIDAKYLLDIVHKIDGDTLHMEIIDGALTMVKGQNAQYRINGMKADTYPTIDLSKPADAITTKADQLAEIIDETAFAASDQETRPVLTGVNFALHDGVLECTATDSYRLAKKTIPFASDLTFRVTIPAKSLNEVKAIMLQEADKDIEIAQNTKKAQFSNGTVLLQTRLLDGGYPDTDRLIPREFHHTLTIRRSTLLSALDRCIFKSDNMTVNRLQCSQDDVIFSNGSQEIGDFQQSLMEEGTKFEGDPIDISFSGAYVQQAARALKGDTIEICFSGPMKPFILKDPANDTILQLALPVRTYN
ncbi:MAG: DNA polymerase III subunit beta [Lactimicrobium massiliense]|nr:DNA polymerase III subunit beta [Lactimicrobium massiliense]MDD6674863.1 DNA polymerase III subunit beta [Lactimicrobium massiliense]